MKDRVIATGATGGSFNQVTVSIYITLFPQFTIVLRL